jgi:hypothetical protein
VNSPKGSDNNDQDGSTLRPLRDIHASSSRFRHLDELGHADAVETERKEVITMFKMVVRYARYAVVMLAAVGFGTNMN